MTLVEHNLHLSYMASNTNSAHHAFFLRPFARVHLVINFEYWLKHIFFKRLFRVSQKRI